MKNIDIAISFLGEDENYAKELYDVLTPRLDIFYYAERQEELVSKDGEEAFGEVFRDNARTVVIFYREEWGKTMMTRAEKSAIKQRAAKESYEFTIWVPLGDEKNVPAYIDPQFIWYDIDRWGIDGLASIVEKKVQESGKEVRPETTKDRLQRINRTIELEEERENFERSKEGVEFVAKADSSLEGLVKEKIKEFEGINSQIGFKVQRKTNYVIVTCFMHRLVFEIDRYASNVITGASLSAIIDKLPSRSSNNESYKRKTEYKFKPTLDKEGEPRWMLDEEGYTLEESVSFLIDELAELSFEAYAEYKKTGKL